MPETLPTYALVMIEQIRKIRDFFALSWSIFADLVTNVYCFTLMGPSVIGMHFSKFFISRTHPLSCMFPHTQLYHYCIYVLQVIVFPQVFCFHTSVGKDLQCSYSYQGRIQDFYDGVSISKKPQEYIGLISFDQLLTI